MGIDGNLEGWVSMVITTTGGHQLAGSSILIDLLSIDGNRLVG